MSTKSTTGLYDEDLHGNNPANYIQDEDAVLEVPSIEEYYFIIPKAAPFFLDNFEIYQVNNNGTLGNKLVDGLDYKFGHQFVEAVDSIGRPIYGSIRFMRHSIAGRIRLKYRTIGGQWGFNDQAIAAELSRRLYNPLIRSWGQIDILTATFPNLEHDQSVDSMVGSKELKEALDRLADVMEATASGTTESHLDDFNNPHRVTKYQVDLGNVPNFKMATEAEHLVSNQANLFTNPLGVVKMIDKYALVPLTTHINDTGNVHDLKASDINLGNVPNYPAATPAQAIDPTNNQTLLTPYLATLLFQNLGSDPRLAQLIIDFNKHLTDVNPHSITPAMIGTLTEAQIRALIGSGGGSGGGDASTFGGLTPEEWEDLFPANDDILVILDEEANQWLLEANKLSVINLEDPTLNVEKSKIISSDCGYGAYLLTDSTILNSIVSIDEAAEIYPSVVNFDISTRWLSLQDANYFAMMDGGIKSVGSAVVNIPAPWVAGATEGVQASVLKGNANALWVKRVSDGAIVKLSSGVNTVVFTGTDNVVDYWVRPSGPDDLGVATKHDANDDEIYVGFGTPAWVTAITPHLQLGTRSLEDCQITNSHVVISSSLDGEDTSVKILSISRETNGTYTLTNVTNSLKGLDLRSQTWVTANMLTNISACSGEYDNFSISYWEDPYNPNNPFIDAVVFGSNEFGQMDIIIGDSPLENIGVGKDYIITLNGNGGVTCWGDNQDNQLAYIGTTYLEV